MTVDEISRRINEICDLAKSRSDECGILEILWTSSFLTQEEKEELHRLKMALPTSAEEREAAVARIRARINNRKRRKNASVDDTDVVDIA